MISKKLFGAPLMFMLLTGTFLPSAFAVNDATTPVEVHSGKYEIVDANVIVSDETNAVKVEANGTGEDKDTSVTINGNAELSASTQLATAVTVYASTGNASAEITGNVKANSQMLACGVTLDEDASDDAMGKANVKVGGNIQAEGEIACGLGDDAGKADVSGHITAQGKYATGVQSYNEGDETIINVKRYSSSRRKRRNRRGFGNILHR